MSKKKYGMKCLKKDMREPMNINVGTFLGVLGVMFLLVVFGSIMGDSDGYDRGYDKAMNDNLEKQNWDEWKAYSFEVQKQSFWSVIMWEVGTHTTQIFFTIVLLLFALFIRW